MLEAEQLGARTVGPNDGCREFDAGLAAFLEQEGDPGVAAHAEHCAFCGALLRDLQLLIAESGRLDLQNPPASVWLNIRAALAAEGLLHEAGASEACRTFYAALSTYLEGEKTPAVARHAEECAFCGVVLSDLELLVSEAGRLQLMDPPPRVWANIRATLAAEGVIHEQLNPWTGWLRHFEFLHPAPVAAMAGVIFLGVLLLGGPRVNTRNRAESRLTPAEDPTLVQTQESVRLLERSYHEREPAIAPEVKADFRKSLESLNSSILEAEQSIERGPDSSLAREYLQGAYIRKAQVLSSALEYAGR
jgi:hypothetical protein